MKARRCKKDDLFAGRRVYFVSAGIKLNYRENNIHIEERVISGKPSKSRHMDALFVNSTDPDSPYPSFVHRNSLRDWGVMHRGGRASTPAVHRIFLKLKQAEQYRDRLMRGCYNANERDLVTYHSITGNWARPFRWVVGQDIKKLRRPRGL